MYISKCDDIVLCIVEKGTVAVKVNAVVTEDDIPDDPLVIGVDIFVKLPEVGIFQPYLR